MVIDKSKLEVVSSIAGMLFVLDIDDAVKKDSLSVMDVQQTSGHNYEVGEVLTLIPEKRWGTGGRVTHWRVKADGHPDAIISDNMLEGWRVECVVELTTVA